MEQTQRSKIFNYLKKYGSITVREAFEKLKINSPTKRLSEMRRDGLIWSETVKVMGTKEDGSYVQRTHFERYYLTQL